MKRHFKLFAYSLLIPAIILTGNSCAPKASLTEEMILMGTTARITIVPDSTRAKNAAQEAFSILKNMEKKMSFYGQTSELAKINNQAAENPVTASEEMIEIIQKSIQYSKITGDAFDITATSLQEKGGYDNIVVDDLKKTVYFKKPKTKIDLGGIAVGFSIDRVVEHFKKQGIDNFLIDIGGDIYARGRNADNQFWRIGIRKPSNQNEIIEKISIINESVTTSGNYLRKHILNPEYKSQLPADILSATVIAKKCIDADALATAFFVLGKDKTKEFLKQHPKIKAILIINNNGRPEIVRFN